MSDFKISKGLFLDHCLEDVWKVISMKESLELFHPYCLENKRKTIASSQLICGVGLFLGLELNTILILSSAFLGVMMLVAIGVRIKIKDNISDILPALAYLVLSVMILYEANT